MSNEQIHLLKQMFNLDGKVALVTGGSGYLGSAICEALAEFGANIIIASRDIEKNNQFIEQLKSKFPMSNFSVEFLDMTDNENIYSLSSKIEKLDILVNNAYLGRTNSFHTITFEEWEQDIKMNLSAVFKLSKVFFPHLKQSKGVILNIASMYGHVAPNFSIYENNPFSSSPSYGVSKAGVIQLTKYLGSCLADDDIRVNCISPGPFPSEIVQENKEFIKRLSERNPLQKIGMPFELKGAVLLLCSSASSYMTGQNICVDGGWSIW